MSVNLATMLKEGTKKSHSMAENMGFIKCFLKGVVEKNSYRKLAANLYFVYGAMEEEMERLKDHPLVSKIYFPELNRESSLAKDLQFYYGSNWKNEISITPNGQAYVDRIHEIANTAPELFAAHSYTRYLGDLSGGQILKNIAEKAMNLDGEGTAFYEFETITDEKAFKNMYRQALNDLPVDQETADRIVQEANEAFGMNMKMFQELEGNLVMAIGKMLFNSLTSRRRRGSNDSTNSGELATAE
ncbi:heme oxygenase (biliverdin-producing) [Geminocystis sp. NIES-3709]|uniref:biliverdin-producing heme oxygenase n=1 Tax=Geminocystis sp. NIES-3709 TaxID=1617448 RepID=UPI0005FC6F0B|nr:heme oxygenase (biliverdin-producing) [Geminocystis sp. NIES-3709]BAQ66623.1 heme oxygenase [Geminocystis sp. NIES-3709]